MKKLFSTAVFGLLSLIVLGSFAGSEEIGTNLYLNGDLRFRHDMIDAEGKDARNRQCIRARLNIAAKMSDELALGFQVATGSDDPVSTNQSLDSGFSSKGINFDLAYFNWKPSAVDGLSVSGGKIKTPYHTPGKTELLWDGDLRPEGLSAGYNRSFGAVTVFGDASYFIAEERSTDKNTVMLGLQGGVDYDASFADMIFGVGYFDYQNTLNNVPLFDASDSAGNSVSAAGKYMYDYDELELFIDIEPKGLPGKAGIFADYVVNIAENVDDNIAWLAGFSLGSAKTSGTFDFKYSIRRVEKDAVVGAFTDSDFIGGGTNGSGHELNFNYAVTAKTKLSVSCFLNETDLDKSRDFHRVLLDLAFHF